MLYQEQQQFINYSRIWGAVAVAFVVAFASACLGSVRAIEPLSAIEFGLITVVLASSIYYTPDYLHLTVNVEKRQRWETKIRWRAIGAFLAFGLLSISSRADALTFLVAVTWLTGANLLAAKLPRAYGSFYFWATDFTLLAALVLSGRLSPTIGAVLLAAAAHLSIVISEKSPFRWASAVGCLGCLLLFLVFLRRGAGVGFFLTAAGLLLISVLTTAFLVRRAQQLNTRNVGAAMRELMDFTGYSADHIWHLWSVSNQELAKSWESAGLAENDAEDLAQWYRENSQLYMFAISAYNLDYKRIRSNLKVLRFARGSCLDYGAGNGEIVLDLARRGHRVSYYDVEGETMKFARQRALQQALDVEFLHSKEALAASALKSGFDTVFSFDVLEHLPDLPGELNFLSSLLNPGGLLVFDVPAGSTKSHPMHLNHNLDIRTHMLARGLQEERSFMQKLPFKKEEKYFFRALGSLNEKGNEGNKNRQAGC